MTLDVWGPEPRLSWTREAQDDEGRPLQVEQREFDYGEGVGQVVPAGTFDCVKVELVPAGINKFLARLVLPRIYMWQTEAPPHFWVKYQGPDGGQLSREIVRELVHYESAQVTASD